jgi:hypothetical protein
MEEDSQKLFDECCKLPLFHIVWFRQNIQGLSALDSTLRKYESEVLRLFIEQERTPFAEVLCLQSMSQCWMFGMYELFRTWRQMVNELIVFAEEFQRNPAKAKTPIERSDFQLSALDEQLEQAFYGELFETVKIDQAFRNKLISTKAIFKDRFKPIEELRVLIAKFEVPETGQGRRRFAMPYARIDTNTGSLYWMITLNSGQSNFASRQAIAYQYIALAKAINHSIHPTQILT